MKPLQINIGARHQIAHGWLNLDYKLYGHPLDELVTIWQYPSPIPAADSSAGIVMSSHFIDYVPDDEYVIWYREVFRVLAPGGVFRMSEAQNFTRGLGRNYRGLGILKSRPSFEKCRQALERAGFADIARLNGREIESTRSPHRDVIRFNSRESFTRRGKKFYAEATKPLHQNGRR